MKLNEIINHLFNLVILDLHLLFYFIFVPYLWIRKMCMPQILIAIHKTVFCIIFSNEGNIPNMWVQKAKNNNFRSKKDLTIVFTDILCLTIF